MNLRAAAVVQVIGNNRAVDGLTLVVIDGEIRLLDKGVPRGFEGSVDRILQIFVVCVVDNASFQGGAQGYQSGLVAFGVEDVGHVVHTISIAAEDFLSRNFCNKFTHKCMILEKF